MVKCVVVKLTGKIQGVFFRDFAKQNANKLGLVGHAKNLNNGSLEIIAQGDESKLKRFLDLMRSGPMTAKVEGFDVSYIDFDPERVFFDIR